MFLFQFREVFCVATGMSAETLVRSVAFEALGLDPWELLRWARDWSRRLELDRSLRAR